MPGDRNERGKPPLHLIEHDQALERFEGKLWLCKAREIIQTLIANLFLKNDQLLLDFPEEDLDRVKAVASAFYRDARPTSGISERLDQHQASREEQNLSDYAITPSARHASPAIV